MFPGTVCRRRALPARVTDPLQSALASIAAQMGADHKYDLTSDVTHLVVGSIDTPKYKYVAKERADVKVVVPEFIEAVRRSWMEGGDTDVAALEVAYKVPTFFGLRICVTGFEDRRSGRPIKWNEQRLIASSFAETEDGRNRRQARS